jgi:hypothetical protein
MWKIICENFNSILPILFWPILTLRGPARLMKSLITVHILQCKNSNVNILFDIMIFKSFSVLQVLGQGIITGRLGMNLMDLTCLNHLFDDSKGNFVTSSQLGYKRFQINLSSACSECEKQTGPSLRCEFYMGFILCEKSILYTIMKQPIWLGGFEWKKLFS